MDTIATPELKREIKDLIIRSLKLPDVRPEDMADDAPLFEGGGPLSLDSIDALEIVVALQRRYGVRIDGQGPTRHVLRSVDTIAEFVAAQAASPAVTAAAGTG